MRLDAESPEPLVRAGQHYDFVPPGSGTGIRALALALDCEGLKVRGRWPGLIRPPELLPDRPKKEAPPLWGGASASR